MFTISGMQPIPEPRALTGDEVRSPLFYADGGAEGYIDYPAVEPA